MGRGINKAILIGNLGGNPEVKITSSGASIATFNFATSESWKNSDGTTQYRTEWHRIVAFGRLAEICGEYLRKGSQVYIEGRIQTRNWEDKDGNKRFMTEIVAQNMQMLGTRTEAETEIGASAEAPPEPDAPPEPEDEEDLPF